MIVAERKFVINASQERVWESIGDAILGSLRLERMQVMDENNTAGVVRVKMGFVSLPMNLRIQLADISSPDSLIAKVVAKTRPGIFTIHEETKVTLAPINEDRTEVAAKATVEKLGIVPRLLFLWKITSFAKGILDDINKYFERMASGM